MESVFLELVNRSINAGWLVLVVVLLRRLLKKAPKAFFIVLWALVGIRLVCPFSPESVLSLIPDAEPIPTAVLYTEQTAPSDGVDGVDGVIGAGEAFGVDGVGSVPVPNVGGSTVAIPERPHPVGPAQAMTEPVGETNRLPRLLYDLSAAVWLIGMIGLLLYAAISSLLLRRKIRESIPLRENVRLCDCIATPFLLGIFRPHIYLPFSLSAEDAKYAIAHERAHWKRHDHWWKLLGFLLLSVYWFQPLLWVAYVLLCRDIELACDEKVIRQLGAESKKSYSNALINCSVPRRTVAFCPLAFGEVAVKERVKTVLHYKKPKLWLHAVTVLTCIVFALCFLTNPISTVEAFPAQPTAQDSGTTQAPADEPAEDAPAEDAPAEDAPAEDVPAEDVPAEDAPANEPFIINVDDGWNEEETAMMSAVLGHRAVGCYRSGYYDSYGWHEDVNYELPAEIVEKYGTSDSRELPLILVYVSDGELDYVETLELYCGINDLGTGTTHVERTEVVSVEIPAGGIAFCPLPWDCIGYGIIGGTYGDKTIEILDSSEPQASIHDPRRYE